MRKISGDSQIDVKLDSVKAVMFHPMFTDLVADPEQGGALRACAASIESF